MSSHNFKLYKSFGPLIKDYRQWRELGQELFAKSIGISVRELRRWEAGHRCARIGNLHDFSEATGIPMQVCVALNSDQPIWYSLQKRIFAYSLIEIEQCKIDDFFENHEQSDDGVLIRSVPIITDKHINAIHSCHQDIYGSERSLERNVIKAASTIFPELNRIIFDSWGHYVGHTVCLPIKLNVYQELKKQRVFEDYLTTERPSDIAAMGEGVFFYYSLFGASASVANWIIINGRRYLATIKQKERYVVAGYSPTEEIKESLRSFGMRMASRNLKNEYTLTETAPEIYEIELDVLMRPSNPFEFFGRMMGGYGVYTRVENLAKSIEGKGSPGMPDKERGNDTDTRKKNISGKMPDHDSLINN